MTTKDEIHDSWPPHDHYDHHSIGKKNPFGMNLYEAIRLKKPNRRNSGVSSVMTQGQAAVQRMTFYENEHHDFLKKNQWLL